MTTSLATPALCLVTDRRQCEIRPLTQVVERALDGGVNMVQLREKDLPAGELLDLACQLRELTRNRALLFVNDRIDVALACEADGVQLGESSMPLKAARRASGGSLLLGRSVHSVEGSVAAEADGADILLVGAIFPTVSHPKANAAGVELLERVSRNVAIPILAIGGVKADNIASVIRAGASGAAVISAICRSQDPAGVSAELIHGMEQALPSVQPGRSIRTA